MMAYERSKSAQTILVNSSIYSNLKPRHLSENFFSKLYRQSELIFEISVVIMHVFHGIFTDASCK